MLPLILFCSQESEEQGGTVISLPSSKDDAVWYEKLPSIVTDMTITCMYLNLPTLTFQCPKMVELLRRREKAFLGCGRRVKESLNSIIILLS